MELYLSTCFPLGELPPVFKFNCVFSREFFLHLLYSVAYDTSFEGHSATFRTGVCGMESS